MFTILHTIPFSPCKQLLALSRVSRQGLAGQKIITSASLYTLDGLSGGAIFAAMAKKE